MYIGDIIFQLVMLGMIALFVFGVIWFIRLTIRKNQQKSSAIAELFYLTINTGASTRFAILWLTLPSTISCNVFNPRLPTTTRSKG